MTRAIVDVQLDPVERAIARMERATKDFRPVWDQIGDDLARVERSRFAAHPWRMKASTMRRKAAHWPAAAPMVRTGHLRDSLTHRPFGIERITATTAEFGSGVTYAKYHPQVLQVDSVMRRAWVERVRAYLQKAVDGQ